jgi:hypothetical protein
MKNKQARKQRAADQIVQAAIDEGDHEPIPAPPPAARGTTIRFSRDMLIALGVYQQALMDKSMSTAKYESARRLAQTRRTRSPAALDREVEKWSAERERTGLEYARALRALDAVLDDGICW